jgi:hypothetical protein
MWWECSECGGHIERSRAPAHCNECGKAGVIFVAAEDESILGEPGADSLRTVWLRAGLDQPRMAEQGV